MKLYAPYVSGEPIQVVQELYVGGEIGGYFHHAMTKEETAQMIEKIAKSVQDQPNKVSMRTDLITYDRDGNITDIPYVFTNNEAGKEIRFELSYGRVTIRGGRLTEESFKHKNPAKNIVRGLMRFAKLIREG